MIVEEAARYADCQVPNVAAQRLAIPRNRGGYRGRVARIETGQDLEHRSDIRYASRDYPDMVNRPGIGDRPVPAYAPVRGLETHHATQRGGHTHRTPGIGAERERDQAARDRDRRSGTRPARDPLGIPWVHRGPESRIDSGRAVAELVEVRLAQQDRAGLREPFQHRGVLARNPVLENPRAPGGRKVAGPEHVLAGERHADQRRRSDRLLIAASASRAAILAPSALMDMKR